MHIKSIAALTFCWLFCAWQAIAAPANPTCIVPSEPEGGFQITCELARTALAATGALPQELAIRAMPGGVGAVAYNIFTTKRRAEPESLVAFSEGSLFNLARAKFGPHDWNEVRWVAVLGLDHGAIAVRDDAPWQTLPDLMKALAEHPRDIAIGGSGTINGRDWRQFSRTAHIAGIDMRKVRFVAFEGGGDCVAALTGGHVQVCISDAATTQARIDGGKPARFLAIYSESRLPGKLNAVPTAREQGFDIVWPVVRGLYMGQDVADADYAFWVDAFARAMAEPAYRDALARHHLQPYPLTGQDLVRFVQTYAAETKETEPH